MELNSDVNSSLAQFRYRGQWQIGIYAEPADMHIVCSSPPENVGKIGLFFAPMKMHRVITVTSHERHVVSAHRPHDCLFNSLFGLTS